MIGNVLDIKNHIQIPVSLGELIDKYTILKIKSLRIKNENKLTHVQKELKMISEIVHSLEQDITDYEKELLMVNLQLWDVEDQIRMKENKKEFDELFVAYARLVYYLNDKRFEIKKSLNQILNSDILEEKEYQYYS